MWWFFKSIPTGSEFWLFLSFVMLDLSGESSLESTVSICFVCLSFSVALELARGKRVGGGGGSRGGGRGGGYGGRRPVWLDKY